MGELKMETMNGNLVSIVLPVYNGEKFLAQSIESCLIQSHTNLELIIVNDCSTDSSLEIAQGYAAEDKRIRVYSNDRNLNLPASLNVGHRMAKGEFITWTSDDNFFEANALEVMLEEILKYRVDIVYANFNIIIKNKTPEFKDVWTNSLTLLLGNNVGSCFLYKEEVFKRNNGYDEGMHTIEDYDFWLQSLVHFNFRHIPLVLYNHRAHEESLTSQLRFQNKIMRESFEKKLEAAYRKFFQNYNLENNGYPELFKKFHLNQKFNVYIFLKNYNRFKSDLIPIFEHVDKRKVLKEIDIKLRGNIFNFSPNQNFRTLFLLIKTRPFLLLQYNLKKSLRIILRSLT
ncbi:MAG: glycosyltransferase [Gillisia sp.]